MKLDLSLKNAALYKGCEISEVGGKLTLMTEPAKASNIVGRNAGEIIEAVPAGERDEVALTGGMAIWAYLIVFHQVVHKFRRVVYDDGKGGRVLIAAH